MKAKLLTFCAITLLHFYVLPADHYCQMKKTTLQENFYNQKKEPPQYDQFISVIDAIENGFDINAPDKNGHFPLFKLIEHLNVPVLEKLFSHPENLQITITDTNSNTLLHKTLQTILKDNNKEAKGLKIIELLLNHPNTAAIINTNNAEAYETPLHMLIKKIVTNGPDSFIKLQSTLCLFLEKGADPTIVDENGNNAAQIARYNKQSSIADFMINKYQKSPANL